MRVAVGDAESVDDEGVYASSWRGRKLRSVPCDAADAGDHSSNPLDAVMIHASRVVWDALK